LIRRANADSTTAPSNNPMIHSNVIKLHPLPFKEAGSSPKIEIAI
jgi:hypothetical protein